MQQNPNRDGGQERFSIARSSAVVRGTAPISSRLEIFLGEATLVGGQGARGHGIADRREARKAIDHLQPGQLTARPYVIVGPDEVWPVEAPETYLHPIGQHRFAH
jgi:hypothetical protein